VGKTLLILEASFGPRQFEPAMAYKEACRIMTAQLVGHLDVGTVICNIGVCDGDNGGALNNTDGHCRFGGRITRTRRSQSDSAFNGQISSLEMGRLPQGGGSSFDSEGKSLPRKTTTAFNLGRLEDST
jgi:hypothetical protein